MTIAELCHESYRVACEKGFHDDDNERNQRDLAIVRLALVGTEVSEAIQQIKRHGIADGDAVLSEELADVLIRVADFAQTHELDLDAAIVAKMAKNRARPYLYGTPKSKEAHEQVILG